MDVDTHARARTVRTTVDINDVRFVHVPDYPSPTKSVTTKFTRVISIYSVVPLPYVPYLAGTYLDYHPADRCIRLMSSLHFGQISIHATRALLDCFRVPSFRK